MAATPSTGSRTEAHGSTALVLEFVCLFTHDLRRKQKRWQDGRLKYHSFNKRVMVYDDRGNFVGDMYWTRDWDFDEGEEVQLERGGVIVQVAECVGRQNQDLSELIDKRAKEREQRAAARPAVPHVPMHTPLFNNRNSMPRDHFQTRHRPLNNFIGTPTGHLGRAVVPAESPYEQRHSPGQTPDGLSNSRASKKRRYGGEAPSKMGYAQSLFGAPLTLSGVPMSSAPIRRPAVTRSQPRIEVLSSQEDGNRNSTPEDAAEKVPDRSHNPPGLADTTNRTEHPVRAQKDISTARQLSRREESMSIVDEGEKKNVRHPRADSNNHRGESGHFSHASGQAQKRASLLKNLGNKTRRAQHPVETERRMDPKSPEPERFIIPDEDDEADEELEEEPAPAPNLPNPSHSAAGSKRNAPHIQKQPRAKRKKDILPSNSPPHRVLDEDTPPAPAPDATTTVQAAQDEPRTELRLKSRQKRGLLVVSEMTKRVKPKKKQRSLERSGTEDPLGNDAGAHRGSAHGAAQHQSDGERLNDLPPDSGPEDHSVPAGNPQDPDDEGPFATQPVFGRRRDVPLDPNPDVHPAPQTVPMLSDGDDPFATQHIPSRQVHVSEPAETRHQPPIEEEPLDQGAMTEGSGLYILNDSSPEPIRTQKILKKPRTKKAVYDIPDNTDDEQLALVTRKTAKPKKPETNRKGAKKRTKAHSAEDVGSESEMLEEAQKSPPKARETRASTRKPAKDKPEIETRPRSNKKRRLSGDTSSEEDDKEELPQVSHVPRLAKLSRRGLKSREVFGFVPSSSPPPPAFRSAHRPEDKVFAPPAVSRALIPNVDKEVRIGPPRIPAEAERWASAGGRALASAPSAQRRNALPHGGQVDAIPKETALSLKASVPTTVRQGGNLARDLETISASLSASLQQPDSIPNSEGVEATPKASPLAVKPSEQEPSHRGLGPVTPSGTGTTRVTVNGPTSSTGPSLEVATSLPNKSVSVLSAVNCNASGEQPIIRTEGRSGLHPESHKVPDTSHRPPTAMVRQDQSSSTPAAAIPDGPIRRLPAPPSAVIGSVAVDDPVVAALALAPATVEAPAPVSRTLPTAAAFAPPSATTIPQAAPPPPLPTAAPTPVSPSKPHVVNPAAIAPADTTTSVAVMGTPPKPKIANPASRGRKAALKSDARGQMPQSILPPPDPLADRSNLRPVNVHPPAAGGGRGVAEERPKIKMTFPGFVSAGRHGPWSRAAHDLLESGRPD